MANKIDKLSVSWKFLFLLEDFLRYDGNGRRLRFVIALSIKGR